MGFKNMTFGLIASNIELQSKVFYDGHLVFFIVLYTVLILNCAEKCAINSFICVWPQDFILELQKLSDFPV